MTTFKDTWLYKLIRWIACSFERCNTGSSSRKMTAFAFVLFVSFLHIIVAKIFVSGTIKETQSLIWILLGFLTVDCATILILFNILTGHDIVELTQAFKKESQNDTTQPSDQE